MIVVDYQNRITEITQILYSICFVLALISYIFLFVGFTMESV